MPKVASSIDLSQLPVDPNGGLPATASSSKRVPTGWCRPSMMSAHHIFDHATAVVLLDFWRVMPSPDTTHAVCRARCIYPLASLLPLCCQQYP